MNVDLWLLNSYNHFLHQFHYFTYLIPLILDVIIHYYIIEILIIDLNNQIFQFFYELKIS